MRVHKSVQRLVLSYGADSGSLRWSRGIVLGLVAAALAPQSSLTWDPVTSLEGSLGSFIMLGSEAAAFL
jgi:hypothetical protein